MMFADENINDYRCADCIKSIYFRHIVLTTQINDRKCPKCGKKAVLYNYKILKGLHNV